MNNLFRKITAGALALGLVLGCSGCAASEPEVTQPKQPEATQPSKPEVTIPTVHKEPSVPVTVSGDPVSPHLLQLDNLVAAPEYPQMPKRPQPEDYPTNSQQFFEDEWQWEQNRREYDIASPESAHDLDPFIEEAIKQFLSGDGNQVCSPLNIYFTLAMLARTTDGSSRQQILDVLGHSSMDSLSAQANQLWRAHYSNDGQTISLLANSVWLDSQYRFVQETLDALAKDHYASVFNGDLGTAEMNRQLAAWLDSQTGGLLTEYTGNIKLEPETVFTLASTAYFSANWVDDFYEGATKQETFHAEGRDIITDFMHQTSRDYLYYEGNDFDAISLALADNHRMWLILPDQDSSPKALLEQGDCYDLISHPDAWTQCREVTVNLSLPKFDVSSGQDLISGLKAMGITDVCNPVTANYSPITTEPLYLGGTQHAARVAVDEGGVIAAAYTLMKNYGEAMPEVQEEIDFTLDRPFLFAITGADDLPLFAGVVAEP